MKTLRILMTIVVVATLFQSCKKGENDPFLSLKTRDARITGDWELTYGNETYTYTENYQGDTYEESASLIVENGIANETEWYSYTMNGVNETDSYSYDPYSYEEITTIEKNGDYSVNATVENSKSTNSGNWYWFDTAKKKTQLVIGGMIYYVDRLTNKELVLKAEEFEQVKYNEDGEQYLESYSIEKRFEKKK